MTSVVIFLYKRHHTLSRIFDRIRDYHPDKVYLIADGPKTSTDQLLTNSVRNRALELIDWRCEVITRFSDTNIGVYQNIGEGAKWVFQREKNAIFLEDDTLPSNTFFRYCDELLGRYEKDTDIFWICGTNYFNPSPFPSNEYYYTRCLLPCGWASWSHKFLKYYDGTLSTINKENTRTFSNTYLDKRLSEQEYQTIFQTKANLVRNIKSVSWDRQVNYSIRSQKLFGIAPAINQIQNIGVDDMSTHGGTTLRKTMTRRFCEIPTGSLLFPLKEPVEKKINLQFETMTEQKLLYPLKGRLTRHLGRVIKRILGIDVNDSLRLYWKNFNWKK